MMATLSLILGADGDMGMTPDAARMEGVWRFDFVEVDGTRKPEPPFATNKVIMLKDGRFVITQGSQFTHGVMKIDSTKKPKQYDSTITRGTAKGLTFSCIYELDGDSLKLCGSYRGGDRPGDFVTGPGSGLVMQVLKREKQNVQDALREVAQKELFGSWQGISCTRDGSPESGEDSKKMRVAFDPDGKITVVEGDGVSHSASTTIDALVDPLAIDIVYTDGKMKGQIWLGIATIDGDSLTICRAMPGKTRPTEFRSDPGSGRTLVTWHRLEAEKK